MDPVVTTTDQQVCFDSNVFMIGALLIGFTLWHAVLNSGDDDSAVKRKKR